MNRLKDYKARLVVFPKRNGAKYARKGDASAEEVAAAVAAQSGGSLNSLPKGKPAVTVGKVTEDMKDFKAYYTLRNARNEARLLGVRDKKKREAEEAER